MIFSLDEMNLFKKKKKKKHLAFLKQLWIMRCLSNCQFTAGFIDTWFFNGAYSE